MPRPSRRFVLLVLVIGVATGFWLWHRAPREPEYNGHKLSWWVHGIPKAPRHNAFYNAVFRTSAAPHPAAKVAVPTMKGALAAIEATKPDSILWLAHTAEYGGVGRNPSPNEITRRWTALVEKARVKLKLRDAVNDGNDAMDFLCRFGPEAAPAIPALVRAVDRDADKEGDNADHRRASRAVEVLNCIGPAGWVTYLHLLETRPPHIRALLISGRRQRLQEAPLPEVEHVEVLGELMRASCDPDARVRYAAAEGIAVYGAKIGFSPAMEPALPAVIELLSDPNILGRPSTRAILADYGREPKTIPRLIELLDHPNPGIMEVAGLAMAQIAPVEPRFVPRLRTLSQSPDPDRRRIARRLLQHIGRSPGEDRESPQEGAKGAK